MGFGIIEPKSRQHVPGTARLIDSQISTTPTTTTTVEAAQSSPRHSNLKHGTGKDADVLLVPQPSKSPNDPLNWPLWKRDLALFVLCLAGAASIIVGPAIAPITAVLVAEFNTSYTEVAKWSGWQFWASGCAGLVSSAVMRIWGKRAVYLVSIILVFVGCVWNSVVKTGNQFMSARIIQGLGLGAFEAIVPSSIGDMFFVHQRGKRIAFYNLSILGATYFMPVLGGYISTKHGWRTQFIIMSAFLGPICILVFLFVPEHVYNRPAIYDTDISSLTNLQELDDVEDRPSKESCAGVEEVGATQTEVMMDNPPAIEDVQKTFIQELRLYNGRFSNESVWRCMLSPLALLLYPSTIWSFLFQGSFIAWAISVAMVLAQIFSLPPTNFGPEQLGYMYVAPSLGALISYFVAGALSDTIAKWLSKKNNGVFEPEFRILLVIPVAIVSLPGIFAFGYASENHVHWIVPSICYGLLTFGVVMSCTATYSYVLDAYRDISAEMMVSILLLKNFWAFGSTFFINNWVVSAGPAAMFYVIGAVQMAICAISVVMYIFGKVQREFMHQHNLLKWLGLWPKSISNGVAH